MRSIALFCFLLVVLPAGPAPVYADGAPDPLNGGIAAAPEKSRHQGIVMESEEVSILLYDEPRADITAAMVMYNPGKKDVAMTMGFPAPYQEDISGMEVRVDGKPVETRGYYEEGDRNPPYWRVWGIRFPADSRTAVTVSYRSRPDTYMHSTAGSGFYSKVEMKKKDIPRRGYFLKNFSRWTVQYILQTGAQWDGEITRAVFRVRHVTKGSTVLRGIVPCFFRGKSIGMHRISDDEQAEHYWNIIAKLNDFPRKLRVDLSPEELMITFSDIEPRFSLGFVYNPFLGYEKEIKMWKRISRSDEPEARMTGNDLVDKIKRFHEEKQVFPFLPGPKN